MAREPNRNAYHLPFRPFLYHLDQIQDLLQVDDVHKLLHYDGRSVGIHHPWLIQAINIAPPGDKPEWRVEEAELLRWMQHKGFHLYYRQRRY